jgi:prepilin-type N-terminal cleavage/methylation domain-containing protein
MIFKKVHYKLSYLPKAFTLVELLVVVAVLALLASIVFSNLTGAREGAKISNALSFQSQTHTLIGADLVGWWNFDEESGNTAKDISGYGNNGTIVGASRVDGVPGTGGKALDVSGGNYYANIPHNSTQLLISGGTISAWIYPYTLGTSEYGRIVDKSTASDGANGFAFRLRPGSRLRFAINLTNVDPPGLIEMDVWTHVIATWDSEGIATTYINGKMNGNPIATGHPSGITTTNPLRIGITSYSTTSYAFDGLIDDIRIYSRALTASEIQTLYAQNKDKYLSEKAN